MEEVDSTVAADIGNLIGAAIYGRAAKCGDPEDREKNAFLRMTILIDQI